ncbi:MAG UNVERIFIED_CONTAM: hypothetical protein LVT10_11325 [Anaerolineae bacterium]|jgi:hypothetical protein
MILLVSITLQIALLWGLTVLALTGIGLGSATVMAWAQPFKVGDIFTAYWVGMAVRIACLQVWHIWLPINTWAWWGMLGVGLGCLALTFPDWRGLMRRTSLTIVVVLGVVWRDCFDEREQRPACPCAV